ncbi:MAG: BspA family leucine-rich repeat surface protein, partial [Oscillospiraceae bacterium]|nr:BspA family leucine-rich repeat surface protein [Oscillospiraceae bacterium]
KAFDSRGVGKISAIYAAVVYAVKEGADVISLPFDVESKTDSVVLDRAVNMAKSAGVTVVGTADNNDPDVYAKINNGVIFDKNYIPVGDNGLADEEYVDLDKFFTDTIDYEAHDQLGESDSTDHPLLELSELEDETTAAINSEPVVIAEESDEDTDRSKPPVQDSVTVDNTTIERVHIRWLSTSDGADTPAYFGRLKLAPDSDIVRNQMFQIDFALSGQRAYQPGEIELTFPAYLWHDRNDKEPGTLMLSVPEDPETGVEFVWKRVGNNIVITNAKPLSAASKVMIQGTFRDVAAHDMIDETVSQKFSATLTVTTPNNKTATMTSNEIDAEIDTKAGVSYANKTAYNSVTGTYDVYWMDVPSTIPQELLPADKDNYAYIRWYVAGTADGNQPYKMYVEDTIASDADGNPEFGGIMLGVSDIPENKDDPDVHRSNGTYYKKSSDNKTIKALLYNGYSTIVKSAYVWTAYPKDKIPEEKVELNNTQTISVIGWDDSDRCMKNMGCSGCKTGQSCDGCPDCNCTDTREAYATVETKSPTTYTFIKHWSDIVYGEDNHWKLRPDEMYLRIYCKEYSTYYPWRTILLTAEASADKDSEYPNDWTYTWSDEGQVRTYSVAEVIDESKRKGTFDEDHERYVDESGHRMEWQYVLRKTEYDEKTHTWTYTNEYDDGWIKFELSTLEKKVEYKYQDSNLKSTRDDMSLNQLLRGKEVYVQYPIDATISVAKQAVWKDFDVNPNRFVLEDNEYYFNENKELTVNDVDISEVTFDAPIVYRYIDYDKETGEYDKEVIETPETTLYGKVGDEWIPLVILTNNCTEMREDNGAKAEKGYGKSWKVTMPEDKLVSHIKIEFESDDPEHPDPEKVVATTDMNCTVTLRVKPTDPVKEMINTAFKNNDFLCFQLYNKAEAYAIYIGKETKHEEDEYGTEREYKNGDPVSEMKSPATGYLHGRMYRVAAELEKSFTFNGKYDTTNKRAMLHSELTLTQQSDITSRSDYDYALKMGEIPNTNSGTYYDLLPYGVEPIVKSVKFANNKDSIKNVWTISNYKDSGRTMLVVEVNLVDNIGYTSQKKYEEGDGSKYYPEKGYKNTHALIFDSYCSTDLSAIDNGVLRNVAAYEADEGEIGNAEDWTGEPDDPTADNHNQSTNAVGDEALGWMTNLDPNSDAPAFVYAGDEVNLSDIPDFSVSSVEKHVSVTGSGEWSKGENNDVNVQEGGLYSYRLLVTSKTDTTTSDIILLDNIEKYVPNNEGEDAGREGDYGDNQWHGTLLSIDLSQVISSGVAPVIYYSTKDDLDISQDAYNPEQTGDKDTIKKILNKAGGDWTKVTLDKLPDVDLSTVKAIAIDMTKDKDGNDFKLGSNEQLIVYLNMRAPYEKENEHPDYFKDRNNQDTDGTEHEKNAHAYNDIYLNCVQTDFKGESKETGDYIHNSYTKVGIYTKSIEIKKEWDDDDDADAKRPEKIKVTLRDNDKNPVAEVELSEKNNWTAEIDRLLTYDEDGNYINYTFVEEFEGVGEYKLTVKRTIKDDGSIVYTLNNYHEPEKIDIPVTKTWQDEDSSKRPAYITVKLYAKYPDSDERVLVETIKIDSSNGWKGVFEGLNKNYKGERIEYTIEEEPVYDYVPGGETTGNPQEAEKGFTLLNKYYPYGNLSVTKHVVNGTDKALKNEFTFTLTLETQDGKDVTDRYDYIIYDSKGDPTDKKGKIGNGGEFTLKDGERIEIKDIPTQIKYTVTEASKSGFTLTKTVNDTGEIVSWPITEAEFTNEYSAAGFAPIDALKLLSGRDLLRYQFSFELYEIVKNTDGTETETLLRTVYNDKDGNVSFGNINYTNADDGKEHKYKIVELKAKDAPGYTYDPSVYYAKVTPSDNGDGTMTCVVKYYDKDWQELNRDIDGKKYDYPVFGNTYEAKGSISLRAWKVLDGRRFNAGDFTFNLYDSKLKYISDASNDANGRIDFDEIKYTEANVGDVYWYYAREVKDGDGDSVDVVFDTAVIGYRVEVVDNGNGTLSFNQSSYYMNDLFDVCSDCESTGKSDGKDCTVCGGFGYTWKVGECQICGGTGYADGEVCGDCDGTGREWTKPEKSVIPTFNNSLKPGSLSVVKYTQGGEDPNQEFHFKVKLIGDKVEDGELEYEITVADKKDFPVSGDVTTEWEDIFGDADPFSRFSSLNIDEDIESDKADKADEADEAGEANADYPIFGNLLPELPLPDVYEDEDIADDEADNDYPIMPIAAGENPFGTVKWSISGNTLVLEPADGETVGVLGNTTSTNDVPWYNQRTSIKNIQINGSVKTGQYADYLFSNLAYLESLAGLANLDVSGTESMRYMFYNCYYVSMDMGAWPPVTTYYGITSLAGLEGWDVRNVKDMSNMFNNCCLLESIDALKDWDVKSVTDMNNMFYNCQKITSVKALEKWKPGNVKNMSNMFRNCSGITSFDGLAGWDVSNVTNMSYMFSGCSKINNAGYLKDWDVGKVTDMSYMFNNCGSVTSFNDIKDWNVSSVENIQNMFSGCSSLTSFEFFTRIDISKFTNLDNMFQGLPLESLDFLKDWDVSHITSMKNTFRNCKGISSLEALKDWDIRNVTDMSYMFSGCSVESLEGIADWNVGSVTDMSYMFSGCSNLESLEALKDWNVGNVGTMEGMFQKCESLTSLEGLENWEVSQVTKMNNMFQQCTGLVSVKALKDWDVSSVETMQYMFHTCGIHVADSADTGLPSLEGLENWNVSNVGTMEGMFQLCSAVKSLEPLSDWNVGNVDNMQYMFSECHSLISLEGIESWNVSNVTNMDSMFAYCGEAWEGGTYFTGITSIEPLENWNVSKVTKMSNMFNTDYCIESVEPLSGWSVGSVTNMERMFNNNYNMESVEPLSGWNVGSVTNMENMFNGCKSIESIDALNGWNVTKVTNMKNMFVGCDKLISADLSDWTPGPGGNNILPTRVFSNCPNLEKLYLDKWIYAGTTNEKFDDNCKNIREIRFSPDVFRSCSLSDPHPEKSTGEWVNKEDITKGLNAASYTSADLKNRGQLDTEVQTYVWQSYYTIYFNYGDYVSDTRAEEYGSVNYDYTIADTKKFENYVIIGWKDAKGNVYRVIDDVAAIPTGTYDHGEEVTLTAIWGDPELRKTEMHDGEFEFSLKGGEKATFDDIPAGTAYQVWEETPDGWVLVKQVNVSGVIEPLQTAEAEFYNLYQREKTTAIIRGVKLLDNKAADTDADGTPFKFELLDKDGEVIQTVTAQEGGLIQFKPIEYDEADVGKTFTYIVREKAGDSPKIRYDSREWEVKVTVTRTDEGVMGTTVEYNDITNDSISIGGVRFENTTLPGSLELHKVGEGVTDANKDTIFKFRVKLYNENGMPLTEGSYNWYVKDAETGEIDTGSADEDTGSDDEDTGSGDDEQDETPADTYAIAGDDGDYPIMPIAADESESHPVKWRVVDNTLILEPKDGNSYGVLPNITDSSQTLWYAEKNNFEYIKINGDVRANKQAKNMFSGLNLKSLEGLANLDVSDVENMAMMFSGDTKLTSLAGLENWDVSNVKNMSSMFNSCENLESVDALKNWNVGKVTDMSNMFNRCFALTSLTGLENWNVSSVTDMSTMFKQCFVLTSLAGLENWNVSNVKNMDSMFNDCYRNSAGVESGLASIAALKYWNVSNVTTMKNMFFGCKQLTSLTGLEDWTVTRLTESSGMFNNCTKLIIADLRSWKADSNISPNMFKGSNNLKKLYLNNWSWDIGIAEDSLRTLSNISEIIFSDGAFKAVELNTPSGTESTGRWVKKDDLALGPAAESFASGPLHTDGVGEAGATYVWQSYYTITLAPGDHAVEDFTRTEYGSVKYDYDITYSFTPATGYVFAGWKNEANNKVYPVIDGKATIPADGTYKYKNEITLTAIWVKADEDTKVTYYVEHYLQDIDFNSYTRAGTVQHTVTISGEPIIAPLLDNYDGFIKPDEKWIIVTDEGELVVKYYYNRMRYTVHFKGNGADGGSMSDIHMTGGYARALGNGFTKTGHAFLGWSTEPEGEVKYNAFTPYKDIYKDFPEGDGEEVEITLYAQWLKLDQTVEPSLGEIIVSCKAGQTIVIDGLPAGTTYEIEEIDVPYGWEIVDESRVSGRINAGGVPKAFVTNKYTASGSATITAHKMLEGGDLTSGMFGFELWPTESKYQPNISHTSHFDSVGNWGDGSYQTSTFNYTADLPGVKKLHVKMKYYTFANVNPCAVYVYDSNDVLRYQLDDSSGTVKDIEFDVDGDKVKFCAGLGANNNRAPSEYWAEVTEALEPIATVTNGTVDDVIESVDFESGEMVTNPWYGTAPVIFSGLEFTEPGEYRYYIVEKIPEDIDGIVYDENRKYVTINVFD